MRDEFSSKLTFFCLAVALVAVVAFMSGCSNPYNDVAQKIAAGESLTKEEANTYGKSKDIIDSMVHYAHYIPMTQKEKSEGMRQYLLTTGILDWFDSSKEACKPFGFCSDDKVKTPKGPAYVVGVKDSSLYFHVEGNFGAEYWGSYKEKEFREKDFRLIQASGSSAPLSSSLPSDLPGTSEAMHSDQDDSAISKVYLADNGETYQFNTSLTSCESFGFFSGDRVKTPRGQATVIGVNAGRLWFHVDGDKGATYWGMNKKSDFERLGFFLMKSAG